MFKEAERGDSFLKESSVSCKSQGGGKRKGSPFPLFYSNQVRGTCREPPGKLIMCFLQFVGHRVLCHMPEASEGREAVVESILVCGKGQEKQLRLTLCTPRICHSRGLIRASLNHVWAIGESLLGFLNPTWDSLLEGRGGGDPKWPTKGCTYPFKGIAGERFLQWNSNSYNGFKESTKCPDTETKCNPSWSANRDFSWAWPLPSFPTPIFQR